MAGPVSLLRDARRRISFPAAHAADDPEATARPASADWASVARRRARTPVRKMDGCQRVALASSPRGAVRRGPAGGDGNGAASTAISFIFAT
jgi:hypothetical protein